MAAHILLGVSALLLLLAAARWLWLSKRLRDEQDADPWEAPPPRPPAGGGLDVPGRPPTLRPVINENRCIGCAACLAACPEEGVFAIVDFETRLADPSKCLGHGACATACPTDAITLMLGTAARGAELPELKPNFATRVPGLYVAGELGGMGLIRNAVEQGRRAVESIRRLKGAGEGGGLDLVIVGAGPAGLGASLAAVKHGLRYATLEQYELGGALRHYPRHKVALSAPAKLPLVGEVDFNGKDKEALLELWRDIGRQTGVKINCHERVESISREGGGFLVRTSRGKYQTRAVLLATGRGGTPQTLGVPGETLAKVAYRLIDPGQYRGRRVLVVGGGDAAAETAIAIALEQPAAVTLAHRGDGFSRCGAQNRERLGELERAGRLRLMPQARVVRIDETLVEIESPAGVAELPNDDVIVCAGGAAPDEIYKTLGITTP